MTPVFPLKVAFPGPNRARNPYHQDFLCRISSSQLFCQKNSFPLIASFDPKSKHAGYQSLPNQSKKWRLHGRVETIDASFPPLPSTNWPISALAASLHSHCSPLSQKCQSDFYHYCLISSPNCWQWFLPPPIPLLLFHRFRALSWLWFLRVSLILAVNRFQIWQGNFLFWFELVCLSKNFQFGRCFR